MSTSVNILPSKIDLTPFPSLYCPENILLHNMFKKYGYGLRICGGAVRDVLLGIEPKDVDFATDATPSEMHEMFIKENIRTLNRNGEAHGTVTVRINDKVNFEVTTLRIDIDPDGRHSKVEFTKDWKLDAERRDLTVNSMFLALDDLPDTSASTGDEATFKPIGPIYGQIYDYFNGCDDLANRRIRFVGDPTVRIREDYLRILRYFRFHGRLARESNVHDEAAVKAIQENCAGLSMVSGERCWVELKSILTYPSAPSLLRRMHELGVFPHIGFPTDPNFGEMDRLWQRNIVERQPLAVTCLVSLLKSVEEVETLNERLKLSNQEVLTLLFLIGHRDEYLALSPDEALQHYQNELLLSSLAVNKLRLVLIEMMYYTGMNSDLVQQFSSWEPPRFPVNGLDLSSQWAVPKRQLKMHLSALKRHWVETGCVMDAHALLSEDTRRTLEIPVELSSEDELFWMRKKKRR